MSILWFLLGVCVGALVSLLGEYKFLEELRKDIEDKDDWQIL
jgi:hypothetical protein